MFCSVLRDLLSVLSILKVRVSDRGHASAPYKCTEMTGMFGTRDGTMAPERFSQRPHHTPD